LACSGQPTSPPAPTFAAAAATSTPPPHNFRPAYRDEHSANSDFYAKFNAVTHRDAVTGGGDFDTSGVHARRRRRDQDRAADAGPKSHSRHRSANRNDQCRKNGDHIRAVFERQRQDAKRLVPHIVRSF
jgi:hypothetical protein